MHAAERRSGPEAKIEWNLVWFRESSQLVQPANRPVQLRFEPLVGLVGAWFGILPFA